MADPTFWRASGEGVEGVRGLFGWECAFMVGVNPDGTGYIEVELEREDTEAHLDLTRDQLATLRRALSTPAPSTDDRTPLS